MISGLVLATGGYHLKATELISFGNKNYQCPSLPDIPATVAYGTVLKMGDIPIVCGGDLYSTDCYKLVNTSGEWQWLPSTSKPDLRYAASFAQLGEDTLIAGKCVNLICTIFMAGVRT